MRKDVPGRRRTTPPSWPNPLQRRDHQPLFYLHKTHTCKDETINGKAKPDNRHSMQRRKEDNECVMTASLPVHARRNNHLQRYRPSFPPRNSRMWYQFLFPILNSREPGMKRKTQAVADLGSVIVSTSTLGSGAEVPPRSDFRALGFLV